jgi:beta-glucosidase
MSGAASECDCNIYFTSLIEGEYADRSDLRLPSVSVHVTPKDGGGFIVENGEQIISENQEESIIRMFEANPNSAVVLLNGSSVDMSAWIDKAGAVLEAWYPGEQGAKAIAEILFGETNPSAKLPICFPKHAGQMPLHYSYKPSGRGYNYVTDDGRPLYTFGYGLSYTEFEIENAGIRIENEKVTVSFDIKNSGEYDGAEVVQLYLGSYYCDVVRPLKELKAYRRINLEKG